MRELLRPGPVSPERYRRSPVASDDDEGVFTRLRGFRLRDRIYSYEEAQVLDLAGVRSARPLENAFPFTCGADEDPVGSVEALVVHGEGVTGVVLTWNEVGAAPLR